MSYAKQVQAQQLASHHARNSAAGLHVTRRTIVDRVPSESGYAGSGDDYRKELYQNVVNRLSHELGGPLAVLRGYMSLWLDGTLEPQPWCHCEEIIACVATIDTLIDEVGLIVAAMDRPPTAATRPDREATVADLASSLVGPVSELRSWFQGRDRSLAFKMTFAAAHAALVCERSAILFEALVRQLQVAHTVYRRSVPEIERIELAVWLRRSVHMMAPALSCFGHKIALDSPALSGVVMANPHLLAVALVNVLDNAQKFSAPHSRIQLTAFETETSSGFSIRDEGPGLPRDFELRLFGRIDAGRGFASPGLGLGLYIAKQAAELLGGTLTLRSIESCGTSVRVELPRLLGAS